MVGNRGGQADLRQVFSHSGDSNYIYVEPCTNGSYSKENLQKTIFLTLGYFPWCASYNIVVELFGRISQSL